MTVKVPIPIEALDEATREKLGIKLPPTVGELGSSLVTVGRVLQSLKGLSYEEALKVLWQVESLLVRQVHPGTQESTAEAYVPTIEWSLQVISRVFDMDIALLKQQCRKPEIVEFRQVAMYILVMTSGYTYKEIGQAINRTEATILWGFQKVARQIESGKNVQLKEKVFEIWMKLYGKELVI